MSIRVAPPVALVLLAGLLAGAAPAIAAPPGAPAIGYDWMDTPDTDTTASDPDPWPRADAADTGLDDMIRTERAPLEGAIAAGAAPRTSGADQHVLRALRKVGGDYVVLPIFTLHLDGGARR